MGIYPPPRPFRVLTAGMLLAGLTLAGCGNELGGILAEIEDIYDRSRPLLEQQVAQASAEAAAMEAELAAVEDEIEAAQAAFEAAPGRHPRTATFLSRRTPEDIEKLRLYGVLEAARDSRRAAQDARRTAETRGATAERTIERHRQRLAELRTAYEDDTWDLLTAQLVSPRSFLIDRRRAAEAELERLETEVLQAEENRQAREAEREERRQAREADAAERVLEAEEREAERLEREQQAQERQGALAAEREARRQAREAEQEERRLAAEAAAAERQRQAEEAQRAREAEMRDQIPVLTQAIEELYDTIISTHEAAAAVHPDQWEQRYARDRATMAQIAKRQTLANIEGAGNMPFSTLESVFSTVESAHRNAESELAEAREQLAEARAAAAR